MSIKDIFFKDEPNEESKAQHKETMQKETPQIATSTFVNQTSKTVGENVPNTNEVNDNIVKSLWQVLIDKNLPGPDYLEVKNSAAALQAMNLPIDKCYEAGFRTLQASCPDFTKEKLLSSIDKYIELIQQEQADGKKECEAKRQKQIGEKTSRINQLVEHKNDLEKQVEELKAQIASTEESISKLKNEVDASVLKIDREEALFNNSIENVILTLNNDKDIMSKLTI